MIMAVFLVNICKFNGCGLTYPSLTDLIQHIEETHIDYDSCSQELQERQQPACIPLSSALRFFSDLPKKSSATKVTAAQPAACNGAISTPSINRANSTGSASPSVGSVSEGPEDDMVTDSEDSNDSWTTQEEFSAEFIMRYGSKATNPNGNEEKPYACPVPGCKKRYKNVNGIKYHAKNGHKKDAKIRKAFKCHCGKSYKTILGLKNHAVTSHAGVPLTTITTASGEVLQIPTSQVTTLQPVRVSLSALMSGQLGSVPVRTVAASQLLSTSFRDCLGGRSDEEGGRTYHQPTALQGFNRTNTIQVAVPASGVVPLGDREVAAVPVSRLLAHGLGANIKLAQISTQTGTAHVAIASAAHARADGSNIIRIEQVGRRPVHVATVGCAAPAASTAVPAADQEDFLSDSRPVTPCGQRLRAGLPPTPVTPSSCSGVPAALGLGSLISDPDDSHLLPPTPCSLPDTGLDLGSPV